MAKLSIVAGATSQSVNIFVQNSSVTTGAGLTGFAPAGGALLSGMTMYYSFAGTNAASVVQSLSVPATVGAAFSAGSIVEIDATNMPGVARLDLPNAMITTAKGRSVVAIIKGGTNVAPVVLEIELTAVDNQSTAFGLSLAKTTNITGFNDIAATAVVSSGAITTSGGAVSTVTTTTNLTNAPTSGDFTSTMKTSIGTAVAASAVASVTGNVGGSVASVTGAVGSVTGAVGSVTGAVGSVTGNVGGNLVGTIGDLSTTAKTSVSTAVLTTTMTESYPTKGSAFTLAQALYNLVQEIGERAITSTTVTILKRDQSTTAKTYTLNSATAPTSSTEAT